MLRGGRVAGCAFVGTLVLAGCTLEQVVGYEDPPPGTGAEEGDESDEADTGTMRLDLETAECNAPATVSCDHIDDDPLRAIGVGCPGGIEAEGGFTGHPDAITLVHELGTAGAYPAREGQRFVVLSTGVAAQILLTPEEMMAQPKDLPGSCSEPSNCPSTALDGFDFRELPPPIDVHPVHQPGQQLVPSPEAGGEAKPSNCEDAPWLVGTGDCSNTLWAQWEAAFDCEGPDLPCAVANDYAELRMTMQVPERTSGISLDFAFGTIEYPNWWQSPFNDMFVAWLDSETWTGNISFDDEGHPISLNAGFLDYKDAVLADGQCPGESCEAPELDGFALQGHAATRWLNSTAGVRPGEQIELVLAVFDLTDGILDSYVMLDGFAWTCSDNPPVTKPIP